MTIRELIRELEQCDDEVKDYQVGVVFRIQLAHNAGLSGNSVNIMVPDNVDVDNKIIWLKAR